MPELVAQLPVLGQAYTGANTRVVSEGAVANANSRFDRG
jgi:hypothetical protein